jgi:hypothetical protein
MRFSTHDLTLRAYKAAGVPHLGDVVKQAILLGFGHVPVGRVKKALVAILEGREYQDNSAWEPKFYEGTAQTPDDYKSAYQQQYWGRKKAGLCVYCGKEPIWEGRVGCFKCIMIARQKSREYDARKAQRKIG